MKLSQFGRLLQINHVLGRHRLDELILAIHFFRPYRFLSWFSPYRWRHKADLPRGERIRLALQDLGPIFVKFGQILSTRRDLLPEDIADSLAKLQDQVAPFPNDIALALIHAAYEEGEPERIFSHIDADPLASASIAQVHAATLADGKQVILKLVRPGIEKVIRRDVDLLYTLAGLAEKYWSEGKRLRPREVVAELEKNLFDELDMLREAASASQLKRHFADERLLYVPEVYWSLTKPNLLVQERVFGAPISNIALLKQHNIDLELLALSGWRFSLPRYSDTVSFMLICTQAIFLSMSAIPSYRVISPLILALWALCHLMISVIWRKTFWRFSTMIIAGWPNCISSQAGFRQKHGWMNLNRPFAVSASPFLPVH